MIDVSQSPVFIVGLPRAASKWIMNAINTYTECCIVHEMHILRLWRRGNDGTIRKVVNARSSGDRTKALTDLVLSKRLIGCFWRLKDHEYTVFSLDLPELQCALTGVKDGYTMLAAMMEAQRKHYKKWRPGARHPVHFIHLGTLLKWFPDARVLFLTRPMDEVARSWCTLRIPRQANLMQRVLWTMAITTQSYLNALLSKPILQRWRNDSRVLQVSYRELIKHPMDIFERICTHLQIYFDPRMADASRIYDSAFDTRTRDVPPYPIEWVPPSEDK